MVSTRKGALCGQHSPLIGVMDVLLTGASEGTWGCGTWGCGRAEGEGLSAPGGWRVLMVDS